MKSFFLLSIIIVFSSCNNSTIYVSTIGKDSNNGSFFSPVLTIQKALDLAHEREINNILIRKGNYYNVSFTLSERDSGINIIGEKEQIVILYGGVLLDDWTLEEKWFVTKVIGTKTEDWDFRMLLVNDSIRNRSRMPERGYFYDNNKWDHKWMSSQVGWSKEPTYLELTTLNYNENDIGNKLDINNAELTIYHMWDDSYVKLKRNDTINNLLIFDYPATHPPGAFEIESSKKAHQYIVWNTVEGMKYPGQWYLDRTNEKLYYWPLAHEKKENFKAVVPRNKNIVLFEKGSKNITLENLNFKCSGTRISNPGYGSTYIGGALEGRDLFDINLINISVSDSEGWAIKLNGNNIRIIDSEFHNLYAGAIKFTGKNIRIERCGIHDVGKLYNGAVGIMGNGERNRISHCELYNLPYAAINGIGAKSIAEKNLIY